MLRVFKNFGNSIANLAGDLTLLRKSRLKRITGWRSMRSRTEKSSGLVENGLEVSASAVDGGYAPETEFDALDGKLTIAVGRSGVGKGALARAFADDWLEQDPDRTVILLNADYCFDTDTLLNLLGDFLKRRKSDEKAPMRQDICRNEVFRQKGAFSLARPVLVIVIGAERLFGTNGELLSAEFDEMLRSFVNTQASNDTDTPVTVRMLIFATPRSRPYFRGLMAGTPAFIDVDQIQEDFEHSRYLSKLKDGQKNKFRPVAKLIVSAKHSPAHELSAYRRAYYAAYLDPRHLEAEGVGHKRGRLAIEILTVMAYIGQPVEPDVLFLAPRIQRRLRQKMHLARDRRRKEFREVLAWLCSRDLVIELATVQGFRSDDAAVRAALDAAFGNSRTRRCSALGSSPVDGVQHVPVHGATDRRSVAKGIPA